MTEVLIIDHRAISLSCRTDWIGVGRNSGDDDGTRSWRLVIVRESIVNFSRIQKDIRQLTPASTRDHHLKAAKKGRRL